jgi:hypothetical protein
MVIDSADRVRVVADDSGDRAVVADLVGVALNCSREPSVVIGASPESSLIRRPTGAWSCCRPFRGG